MARPVVFVFGLMRTGTTLMQELLTYPKCSFIFHEPWFHRDRFQGEALSKKILEDQFDVLLQKTGDGYNSVLYKKAIELLPWEWPQIMWLRAAGSAIAQVGVKEIRLYGWQRYMVEYDDEQWRIILMVRDPRAIYVSCHNRIQLGNAWVPHFQPFCPKNLRKELLPDVIAHQQILRYNENVCLVSYEQLCENTAAVMEKTKRFIDSPIPKGATGAPGEFHKLIQRGAYELEKHGGRVTTSSVRISSSTPTLVDTQAEQFAGLMYDYRNVWEETRRKEVSDNV